MDVEDREGLEEEELHTLRVLLRLCVVLRVNDPQPDAEGDKLSLSEPVVLKLTETEGEQD